MKKKKYFWAITILTVLLFVFVPISHILKTKLAEDETIQTIPEGYADDASQLNLTKIDTIIEVPENQK